MSSETLRFLDFKRDFLANKMSDYKDIFRISNCHLTFKVGRAGQEGRGWGGKCSVIKPV